MVIHIFHFLDEREDLDFVGAEPMSIDEASVGACPVEKHGRDVFASLVLDGGVAAVEVGVGVEELVKGVLAVVVFPVLD